MLYCVKLSASVNLRKQTTMQAVCFLYYDKGEMTMKVGFIGLGLIGGSIAKALRRVHPEVEIIAYNRTQSVLEAALQDKCIDTACDRIDDRFSDCDYIFLCVPVVTMLDYLKQLKPLIGKNTILTDVGSTKSDIHKTVNELSLQGNFIGGHPMAGSEKTGYKHAKDRLIENAWYVLTPGEDVDIKRISQFSELISSLGALPLVLTYDEHDFVVAAISHLPHVVSASLVNLVRENDSDDQYMKTMAAGGFKDITRISSSSPQMWQEICLANADNICILLDRYIRKLTDFRFNIRNGNAEKLLEYFTECKDYRDSFATTFSGPIKRIYRIYLDLADVPGAIATIATILAEADISIKNIGIVHNREFEQGVLSVEFYSQDALEAAKTTLQKDYTIYE